MSCPAEHAGLARPEYCATHTSTLTKYKYKCIVYHDASSIFNFNSIKQSVKPKKPMTINKTTSAPASSPDAILIIKITSPHYLLIRTYICKLSICTPSQYPWYPCLFLSACLDTNGRISYNLARFRYLSNGPCPFLFRHPLKPSLHPAHATSPFCPDNLTSPTPHLIPQLFLHLVQHLLPHQNIINIVSHPFT